MIKEISIPKYGNYLLSSDGTIFSKRSGKNLKPFKYYEGEGFE